jgi:predicted phosphodiesterase
LSKKKRQKRTTSQKILWLMSLIIAASMVLSLVIVAFTPEPAPAPLPTEAPLPTQPLPTLTPPPSPTVAATEPVIGPQLPTETPVGLPTATPVVTATPTVTATVTPAAAVPALTFAVCGDSRDSLGVYARVLAGVQASGSEFLLHTGDLVNQGSEALWREFEATMAGFDLPFYPVPGNHDGLDGELDGYLAHSGAPAAHYSFDRGPVHFTLADSHNGGIGAAELAWLRDDLTATGQPIKMVFLHHPPFDPDGTGHIMAYGAEGFMALMAEMEVDHVFAGHIHAFAQEARDGVLYTITGGAGAPLYTRDHPGAFHHYLLVSVRGEEVSIEVVKV